MRVTNIQALFDYNSWANKRILTAAARITTEQFIAPIRFPRTAAAGPVPHATLRGTLLHIKWGEILSLDSWRQQPWRPYRTEEAYPDLASVVAEWQQDEAEIQDYLASLTDDDLAYLLVDTFQSLQATTTEPRWKWMAHTVNHGTQHRSEAAQVLTEFGHSPGDLDMFRSFPMTPIEQG